MNWVDIGINIPYGKTGEFYSICPKCSSERKKNKQKCLSVNIDDKIWYCHHCGWSGVLKDDKVKYVKPTPAPVNVSEKVNTYLGKRGISEYTIQRFKICSKNVNGTEWILFPFYKNDELVNYKYRNAKKDFMQEKGAELTMWNYDGVKGLEQIIITEGIMDALSFYESGLHNVCSVPNGATSMNFLKTCFELFDGAKEIIIAADNDAKGIQMKNELSKRIGKNRCKFVEYPENCKDANDVLIKLGKEDVKKLISNSKSFPIDGLNRVRDIENDADYLYAHGVSRGETIEYRDFDKYFSFRKGDMTIFTGIPGSGKSAFLDQCAVRLASRRKWKIMNCSFENQPISLHIGKIASIFTGKPFFKKDGKMNEREWGLSKYFIDEHFFFLAVRDIDKTVDGIVEKIKEIILRFGLDMVIIDPWNYLEYNLGGLTETQYISKALSKFSLLASSYDLHIVLVAHPTKMPKTEEGKYSVPNLYSINGSSHFFNKTDNGIVVHRDRETNQVIVYIQKIRWSFVGELGSVDFTYDTQSGRYAESGTSFEREIDFYNNNIGLNMELF